MAEDTPARSTTLPSDAAAIIDTVQRLHAPQITSVDVPGDIIDEVSSVSLPVALTPKGFDFTSLKPLVDQWRTRPERIRSKPSLLTVAAFIDYLNRFKRADSAVFVSDDPGKLLMQGVVDYHGQGDEAEPSFCTHIAGYRFPLSGEMKAWMEITRGGLVSQPDFSTWLQDHEHEIANPPLDWMMLPQETLGLILDLLNLRDDYGEIDDASEGADATDDDDGRYVPRSALYKLRRIRFGSVDRLVSLSRTLEIAVSQVAKEGYNPKTGERVIEFAEDHETRDKAGRRVTVPDGFFLNIPVFEGGQRHLLPVRLAYRRRGQSPMWSVSLIDPPRLVRIAVAAAAKDVGEKTGLPVIYGDPGLNT